MSSRQVHGARRNLSRRELMLGLCCDVARRLPGGVLRMATFRCDVTPAPGEPLIWVTPLRSVLDPLWAKGLLLEDGRRRFVLCAMDWCALGGAAYRALKEALATGAGTLPDRVLLHTVHQHAAPYVEGDACRLLRELPDPPLMFSESGLREVGRRLSEAVRQAARQLQPVEEVGTAEVRVERVASSRRIRDQGKLVVRYSTGAKDPYQAALPEGRIDPWLRTLSLASRGRPLARLHFYATHPQTFCCDGRASADFVGEARERVEGEEGIFQIYFTGCAGDVTVGKYNDGSEPARKGLADRLAAAMRAAAAATHWQPLGVLHWRTLPVRLPARRPEKPIDPGASGEARYRMACAQAYARRREPLYVTAVGLGPAHILHLPGEPLLEFQEHAARLAKGRLVAVAGYGDIAPGYICPDRVMLEGGYEPSASHVAPGAEAILKRAIRRALAV
ncbi:MAG: hypothetical protein RMI94_04045 [Bryobacterales bacterium]|nr:hypothetical protein [Bryobacteraceae bacterium]MDW8129695.1 hypothetical protein [Bryobacterales bacterium]